MTNTLSLGLAARRTLRILGVLGAMAIGTSAGAQRVQSESQRADSVRAQKQSSATKPGTSGALPGGVTMKQGGATQPGALGGLAGGVIMKQGGAKKPTVSGGLAGGVTMKQGKAAAAGRRSQPR